MDHTPGEIRFLSRTDVEEVLTAVDCLERVEETFRWVGDGTVEQHDPANLWFTESKFGMGGAQSFPASVEPLRTAGHKWLSFYLDNSTRGLPAFNAVNVLSDTETALPLAVLEGQSITAMRTAGHAGVGAKYLAREDSSTIGIVGCGDQGRTHVRVMHELFDVDRVRAFDATPGKRAAFAAELGGALGLEIEPVSSAREAVSGADVICTVTTADEPVVRDEWIEPGTHVAATAGFLDLDPALSHTADKWVVGWYGRDLTWIDGEERGTYGPDTLSAADVHADLVEVLTDEKPGRESADERTVMTHMGMPALDTAVSRLAFDRASEQDVGTKLTLFE